MKSILGFGDVQFNDAHEFTFQAGNSFLDWLESQNFGAKEDTEAIIAGDLTEKSKISGGVIEQLMRLLKYCSSHFSTTYIVVGNHDIFEIRDKVFLPYQFIERYENIKIIRDLSEVTTPNGFECLFMPHKDGDFNEEYSQFRSDKTYDVLSGHFQLAEDKLFGKSADVSNIKAKNYFIGHIHQRINEKYLGSQWACKISECSSKFPRGIKVVTKEGSSHIPTPNFLDYVEVEYPNPLPEKKALNEVYIINGCSMSTAKEIYKNVFLKQGKVKIKNDNIKYIDDNTKGKDILNFSKVEMFDSMITDLGIDLDRESYAEAVSLLETCK